MKTGGKNTAIKGTNQREMQGKWRSLRYTCLKEERPDEYSAMLLSGEIFRHLREVDFEATHAHEELMPQLILEYKVQEPEYGTAEWEQHMSDLSDIADEMIYNWFIDI